MLIRDETTLNRILYYDISISIRSAVFLKGTNKDLGGGKQQLNFKSYSMCEKAL